MGIFDIFRKEETTTTKRADNVMASNFARVTGVKTRWSWGDKNPFSNQLTKTDLKKYYWGNPIVFKGINKKARDLIVEWFNIENPIDGEDVPEEKEKIINDFVRDKGVKHILSKVIADTYILGNGFFEYNCKGNKEPEQPLTGTLVSLEYINPETITNYKYDETNTFVEYWEQKIGDNKTWIHHSRIGHLAFYTDTDRPMGISPIEVARQAIKGDNENTEALAKNIGLFGNPILTINTTSNNNKNEVDDAFASLAKFKKKIIKVGLAGFKDTKFDMLNPNTPNPQATIYHFYVELAAGLEMPMMLLIGEQKGKLTGSEVELEDYYKGIKALQNIHLSPVINKMCSLLFNMEWNYDIFWNPLYVNEKQEIENKTKIMKELGELYSKHGIVDMMEVRQLLREYGLGIPENGELDEPEEPDTNENVIAPIIEPKEESVLRSPTKQELRLSKELKEKYRRIYEEQEKRCS